MVGALLALMTTQIVLRYGFNSSLLWAEEMSRYILIWLAFLGVVLAYERGEVAALTFAMNALPRVPALMLAVLCAALTLVLCALLTWYGWQFAQLAGNSKIPAMLFILEDIFGPNAPEAPGIFWVYVALPVGMFLVSVRLVGDIALCLRAIPSGKTLAEVLSRPETAVVG
jgi:TRAP-type C4-dicarboxylate transport system permease small subunit